MASSEKTTNGLNYWSRSDIPEMADFNADNRIIDAAITKANDPLAQIGEGGIPAAYLAADAVGFGTVVGRNETGHLTPLVPHKNGAALYVCGNGNIRVENWSQGDEYQQLCITGVNLINYFRTASDGTNQSIDNVTLDGIYAIQPGSDGGTMPEPDIDTALVIQFKPTNAGYSSQIWIGNGVYRREKTGSLWGAWRSVYAGAASGATTARPSAPTAGMCYFDTTLARPIWWNAASGTWVDATGKAV